MIEKPVDLGGTPFRTVLFKRTQGWEMWAAAWRTGWGIALACGGAVAAWWLGGRQLVWLGGALGAASGAFAPPLTEWLKGRAEARRTLEALGEQVDESPAGLLDPRRGVVRFQGRELELDRLLEWCQDGPPRAVRLVIGPGGVGKTRLSLELCARLEAHRWRCVRAGQSREAEALREMRRIERGHVLVVVDYAETRTGLGDLLRSVASDDGPVRVLLLARAAGEWWDRLAAADPAVRHLLTCAGDVHPLPTRISETLSIEQIVEAAVPAFAKKLKMTPPAVVRVDAGPGMTRVLDLHAVALVAILRQADGPVTVQLADVLKELLGHEERFWLGSAERLRLLDGAAGLTPEMLQQIVAAGALLGAASQPEAMELLGRVPYTVQSAKVAYWLRDLYPADGTTEWLGSLSPDRLAERLVVEQLAKRPELADQFLSELNERQALRAITVLGRAIADQEEVGLLPKPVLQLLGRVVAGLPSDVELLTAVSDAIPYPSTALTELDLAVTRRIIQALPAMDRGLRARWLGWLSVNLADTGQMAEALSSAQEAVEILRELTAAESGWYSGLATSLSDLGNRFSDLGRPDEALLAEKEAVRIRRELAAAALDRYCPGLAASLTNLGISFAKLGRHGEALPPTQEAAGIRRELAAADPSRYRPDLANTLVNLSNRFAELGRFDQALPPAQEAAEILRKLAAADPDRHRPDLAGSLSNLGIRLAQLERFDQALPPTQEAATIFRELAAAHSPRYRSELAASLSNLGARLGELDHFDQALLAIQEAVSIWRELAVAYPERYRPDLALSLSIIGGVFMLKGRPDRALPPTREALEIRRELAVAYPERYRPDLAASLAVLAICFMELDQPEKAMPAIRKAAGIYGKLATANPDQYRSMLGDATLILAWTAARRLRRWPLRHRSQS